MTLPCQVIFVYGTLKRAGSNHHLLAGQQFVGDARTRPGFRLYQLDGYPGMVRDQADEDGIDGEVWSVNHECLRRLDELEGLAEGVYVRIPIPLQAPFDQQVVEAYLYAQSVAGRKPLGRSWPV